MTFALNIVRSKCTVVLLFAVTAAILALGCDRDKPTAQQTPTPTAPPAPKSAVVMGVVTLQDADDNTGIMVFVPGTSHIGFTDSEGNFKILIDTPGPYAFYAKHEGYDASVVDRVTIEASDLGGRPLLLGTEELKTAKAKLSERDRMGGIKGQVSLEGLVDATGVSVRIRGSMLKTITNTAGEFVFPYVEPGNHSLTFFKSGFTPVTIDVAVETSKINEIATVNLAKSADSAATSGPRMIEGTVEIIDRQGNKQNIFDQVTIGLEGTRFMGIPDGTGKFKIADIPPDIYVISASAPGYELNERIEVDLTEMAKVNVGITLNESESREGKKGYVTGSIEIENLEGESDNSGVIIGALGHSYTALSGPDGNFTIDNVPEGTYTFFAQKVGYVPVVWEEVEVADREESPLGHGILEKFIETPRIVFTDPGDDATNVTIQKQMPIFVRFSKRMDPESVRRSISISPTVSYRAFMGKESLKSDYDLLYILLEGDNPQYPINFDDRYTVTITSDATDYEGGTLEDNYEFSFSTGKPEIIDSLPRQNDSSALITYTDPMIIYFNASIDPATIDGNIEITPEPLGQYYYNIRKDQESGWSTLYVYFYPEADTIHTVRFKRGIRTLSGDSINNTPYDLNFKTLELLTYEDVTQGY